MIVKRFFEPLIAQTSYLIGCGACGEAIVIDANRDVQQYIDAAEREGVEITHVTETHIHADFVSGSRELAHRTGARLCLSDEGDENWKYQFAKVDGGPKGPPLRLLKNGDHIDIGNIKVDVLHTPGHTPEHLTFLITDGAAADRPIAAVTGDFVFVGDVGRPDLLERAANMAGTMEVGARTLWRSLQAFARNPDWLQIWPGHGAGSSCGKGISAIPHSTLGYERLFNWAFAAKSEGEFVAGVLSGQPDPPKYFAVMKRVNKMGPTLIEDVTPPTHMPDTALADVIRGGALVIDTRPATDFAEGHVKGSLNIPLNGSLVTWAGWLVPYDRDFYLIADATGDRLNDTRRALALIGLDRIAGYFDEAAVGASGDTLQTIAQVEPDQLANHSDATLVDVRSEAEWNEGHIPSAIHIPLGHLAERIDEVPGDRPVIVHCQAGGRSAIAASLLQKMGRDNVANLAGGYDAWSAPR